jgi:CheY-like chemotaxis protein
MGGQLAVESEPGVGSRFFFTVPLEVAVEEAVVYMRDKVSQPIPIRLADGYQVLALVADDREENRDVLSRILSDIGVSVITAENGQQAVEAVMTNKLDIVFMDIWMPEMGGLEAAQRIISECSDDSPKLVAVSASVLVHERQQYFDSGFQDFIPKPVDAQQVYECLANLLHVEYEYESGITSIEDLEIALPEDLLLRLRKSAELGQVTELEESLDEIRQMGEEGQVLADHLLKLSRNFDMEGILNVLRAVQHK